MSVTRDNDPVAYTLRLAVCVTAAIAVHLLAVLSSSSQEPEKKAEQQRIAVVLKETMNKVKEEMEKLLQEAQQEPEPPPPEPEPEA
ncbi:MAG: hypothetical protein KF878_29160, partial [Planctomycetes bacterium]|nr:hypothetical protein [Planctomycetota bacterium]